MGSHGKIKVGDKVITTKLPEQCLWNVYIKKGKIGTVVSISEEDEYHVDIDFISGTFLRDEIELYDPRHFKDLTSEERKAFLRKFAEALYTDPKMYEFLKATLNV